MHNELRPWVVVFDLDDTLYAERDYQQSGWSAIYDYLAVTSGVLVANQFKALCQSHPQDPIGLLCQHMAWPESVKSSLVWMYRLHAPRISLSNLVRSTLIELAQLQVPIAVLTDGRMLTQQLKLQALELGHLPVWISEVYGAPKPDAARYEAIMAHWPSHQFLTVGDNPRKDFVTPNRLGWVTLGLRDAGQNIHGQNVGVPADHQPSMWCADWAAVHVALMEHISR